MDDIIMNLDDEFDPLSDAPQEERPLDWATAIEVFLFQGVRDLENGDPLPEEVESMPGHPWACDCDECLRLSPGAGWLALEELRSRDAIDFEPPEDDRLFASTHQADWYQTGEAAWEAAREEWLRNQPDTGEPEDWGEVS